MATSGNNEYLEAKQPEMWVCKVCKAPYPKGARICVNCGSPTFRISAFVHRHRSLVAAVGAVLAFLTVLALFYNVWITQRAVETQRRSFVEEFQPKLDTTCKDIDHRQDTVIVFIDFHNAGHSDAVEVKGELHCLFNAYDTFETYPYIRDRLPGYGVQHDCHYIPNLYGMSFILSFDLDYLWSGENTVKHFDSHYVFDYNARKDRYRVSVTSTERISASLE